MRRNNRTWKEIATELGVAGTAAIWLAGRHRRDGHASARRAILGTLGFAGLRNSEVCELDLGDLDFAHGVIHVRDAKTEAGIRQVNMTPWLHDELLAYRAARADDHASGLRAGAQAPRPPASRRSVRRPDGRRRSLGRVDHHARYSSPTGRPGRARYATGFRRIRPQKRAKPRAVAGL
ncbi:MAG: site-specific integrase [Solirubrobacteraceae bacterium]